MLLSQLLSLLMILMPLLFVILIEDVKNLSSRHFNCVAFLLRHLVYLQNVFVLANGWLFDNYFFEHETPLLDQVFSKHNIVIGRV